jgi:hypothetical protein
MLRNSTQYVCLNGLAAALLCGLIAVPVPGFAKTPIKNNRVTVRIYDYVNLTSDWRQEMETTATRILRQAGVAADLVWCFGNGIETTVPACNAALGPADMFVRIFPPRLALKGHELGYVAATPESGGYVTVFADPSRREARVRSLSDGTLLGHVLAHEMGHLLLGPNAHSSSGIMRPVWRRFDEEWMVKGALVFSAEQAKKMRANLVERASR